MTKIEIREDFEIDQELQIEAEGVTSEAAILHIKEDSEINMKISIEIRAIRKEKTKKRNRE